MPNKTLLIIIAAAVVIAIIIVIMLSSKKEEFPYKKKTPFMTLQDRKIIEEIAEAGYFPFVKVRIADFITTWKNAGYRPKIASRSVDFLACDIDSFEPQFALVYKSHYGKNTNEFLTQLFMHVNIPLFFVSKNFNSSDMSKIIKAVRQVKKS